VRNLDERSYDGVMADEPDSRKVKE
jgi:hypothetical protein